MQRIARTLGAALFGLGLIVPAAASAQEKLIVAGGAFGASKLILKK